MPTPARQDLDRYLKRLEHKYGIDAEGPAPGEDEHGHVSQ
jgi:hypothetical protein